MPSLRTALICLATGIAASSVAMAGDVPPAWEGALVFEQANGDFVALDNATDRPIHAIVQARGIAGALHWRDDGLRVLTWRGDIARVRMPPPGSAATVTNAWGHCLTVKAADDIRWSECRGGAAHQVWSMEEGSLVAPPPFRGFLAHGTPEDDTRLHIVRGDAPLTVVGSVLSAAD